MTHEDLMRDLGFELRDLNSEEIAELPTAGVKVTSIYLGSRVDRTRMDPEYIITKVNRRRVRSLEDFADVIRSAKPGTGRFAGRLLHQFQR